MNENGDSNKNQIYSSTFSKCSVDLLLVTQKPNNFNDFNKNPKGNLA